MNVTLPDVSGRPPRRTTPVISPAPPPQPDATTASSNAATTGDRPPLRPLIIPSPGYQSDPRTSPPAGVQAAHQVRPDMVGLIDRTEPSASATCMPPRCGLDVRVGSQSPL